MKATNHEIFNPLRYWSDQPHLQIAIDPTDAELDREDSLSDRYAFELGREMGVLRLTPPHDQDHISDLTVTFGGTGIFLNSWHGAGNWGVTKACWTWAAVNAIGAAC